MSELSKTNAPIEDEAIRAYPDPRTNSWIIDWNEKVNSTTPPADAIEKAKSEEKYLNHIVGVFGAFFGLMAAAGYVESSSKEAIDALTYTSAATLPAGALAAANRYIFKPRIRRDVLKRYGAYEKSEQRQLTVPHGWAWHGNAQAPEQYQHFKQTLLDAFQANTTESPVLILNEDSISEITQQSETERNQLITEHLHNNPGHIDFLGDTEELIAISLKDPVTYMILPPELKRQLVTLADLERQCVIARHKFEHTDNTEFTVFLPTLAVKQVADNIEKLSAILPELSAITYAVEAEPTIPELSSHIGSLATKMIALKQRDQIFTLGQ